MTGTTRRRSSSAATGSWPGPRRLAADVEDVRTLRRPSGAPVATRRLDRVAAAPAEQAVARERIRRHVEDAHHVRPLAPAERRGPIRVGPGGRRSASVAVGSSASRASVRVAQVRVVDQVAARRPDKIERTGDDDRPGPGERASSAAERIRLDVRTIARGRAAARARARRARPRASPAGTSRLVQMTVAPASAADGASAAMTPSTSLSAIEAVTSVIGPGGQERPQVVEGRRQGGGAGRVVGTVEQDVAAAGRASSSSRPGQTRARVAAPAGAVGGPWRSRPPRAHRASRPRWPRWPPGGVRAGRPASARAAAARPRCRRGPSRGAAPARPRSAARPAAARAGGRPPARHRARRSRPGRRAR